MPTDPTDPEPPTPELENAETAGQIDAAAQDTDVSGQEAAQDTDVSGQDSADELIDASSSDPTENPGVSLLEIPALTRPQNLLLLLVGSYLALWTWSAVGVAWSVRNRPEEAMIVWAMLSLFTALPAGLFAGWLVARSERAATGRASMGRFFWLLAAPALMVAAHLLPMLSATPIVLLRSIARGHSVGRTVENVLETLPLWVGFVLLLAPTLLGVRALVMRRIDVPVTKLLPRRLPRVPSAVLLAAFYGLAGWLSFIFLVAEVHDNSSSIVWGVAMWVLLGIGQAVGGGLLAARSRRQMAIQAPGRAWLDPDRLARHQRLEVTGHLLTAHFAITFAVPLFDIGSMDVRIVLLAIGFVGVLVGVLVGTTAWRDRYLEELAATAA